MKIRAQNVSRRRKEPISCVVTFCYRKCRRYRKHSRKDHGSRYSRSILESTVDTLNIERCGGSGSGNHCANSFYCNDLCQTVRFDLIRRTIEGLKWFLLFALRLYPFYIARGSYWRALCHQTTSSCYNPPLHCRWRGYWTPPPWRSGSSSWMPERLIWSTRWETQPVSIE